MFIFSFISSANQCNPLEKDINKDDITKLVKLIDETPDGPHISLRFLTHKIQSPQEIEAIKALKVCFLFHL